MTIATYGIEVIYKGQQWIVDKIQKVNTRIAKDVAGLRATTVGCDAIRSADIPPTRPMLITYKQTNKHVQCLIDVQSGIS
jgi:hypothetical protein